MSTLRRAITVVLSLLLGTLAPASAAFAHPKPGAHADVRINIEKDTVRFEVLMNILFADGIVNAERAERDSVTEDEEPALRAALTEYFGGEKTGLPSTLVAKPNTITINGAPVTVTIRDMRIIRPLPETRPGFIQNPVLLKPQVHMVIEYKTTDATPAKTVSMVWGTYPKDFLAPDRDIAPPGDIEAVLTSQGQLDLVTFRQREPEILWHAPSIAPEGRFAAVPALATASRPTIPIVSISIALGLALWAGILAITGSLKTQLTRFGTTAIASLFAAVLLWPVARIPAPKWMLPPPKLPTDSEALAIFTPLHANIYRAFDFSTESDIYDALAKSVDGPLLESTYNDVYRGLIMQEEGGALSRVKRIEPVTTAVKSITTEADGATPRFEVETRWRVEGVVYHWGHSHSRTNEYLAAYTVAARPATNQASGTGGTTAWRIVSSKPIEQRRIETPEQAASEATAGGTAAPSSGGSTGGTPSNPKR